MRISKYLAAITLIVSTMIASNVSADTYSTFQTTRYYSANRRYFVEVTEKKRATLYANSPKPRRVWSRKLTELPQQLFVAHDGRRVALVDQYYGNGRSPSAAVVIILNEGGSEIASHQLSTVANLQRVRLTISAAHWYRKAYLDGDVLAIETIVAKYDLDECFKKYRGEESTKCWEDLPYQRLRFALSSGELLTRQDLYSR